MMKKQNSYNGLKSIKPYVLVRNMVRKRIIPFGYDLLSYFFKKPEQGLKRGGTKA